MKLLFHLGHPAHFHLFKNVIKKFAGRGHEVCIVIKKKDVLEELIKGLGMEYFNILPDGRKDSKLGMLLGVIKQSWRLFLFSKKEKPDILLGSTPAIAHVGKLLSIPSINLSEDDAKEVMLFARITYPFSTLILSPKSCDNGKWNSKTIKHESYHELAYLHPNHFQPNIDVVRKYLSGEEDYFIMRFSGLNAYHDDGISGIDHQVSLRLIEMMKPYGRVLISSEKPLSDDLEKYRLNIPPELMHDFMAFAKIYIGDSQTMAAEAGVLGTPFIRINDFVGRLGYLNELENVYKLGYGIRPKDIKDVFPLVSQLLSTDTHEVWDERRKKMLSERTDFAEYLTTFLDEYNFKSEG
ncbi:MAG: DUF354 domain-containing protein [Roseivirga sp.]|nr:DUF354 domain-containing protein [Roseivirga sp.]